MSAQGEKHVRTVRLRSLYDCREMCGRTAGSSGEPSCRAAARCSLPDFDRALWDPQADRLAAAEAQSKLDELIGSAARQNYDLDHDLDRDGCPWGWAISGFATSVTRYLGARSTDSPVRSTSPWLTARAAQPGPMPTRMLELLDLAAAHEDNAYAYFQRVIRGTI